MRFNLPQLLFGVFMLLSAVYATDELAEKSNLAHHGFPQGVLTSLQMNVYDTLHALSKKLSNGVFLMDIDDLEAAQGDERPISKFPLMVKRNASGIDSLVSTTSIASVNPTDSKAVATQSLTTIETTSSQPSTTSSELRTTTGPNSETPTSRSTTSIQEYTTGADSTHVISASYTSTTTRGESSTGFTLSTKTAESSASMTHTTKDAAATIFTSTYTSTSVLPNGSLSTMTSVTVVRVTPTGSSAEHSTGSTTTAAKEHSTQKGVAALPTADLTREVILILGGAALAAMAL
ncbi:hypothetical protein N7454_007618 [Penicillium verhagenii]|nr:hypothetical protein N7454_007618 [Penicillium verhagenii]